jgi:hypothetical protein
VADYRVLRGTILLGLWRWNDAAEEFEEALARNALHERAQKQLELTQRIIASLDENGEPDKKLVSELRDRYIREGMKLRGEGAGFRPRPPGGRPGFDFGRRAGPMGRGAERFSPTPDGRLAIDLSRLPLGDALRILQARPELPVSSLNFSNTGLSDLTVLSGLPLEHLWLGGNLGIVTITPLAGMPLERLDLTGTKVSDLTPLSGSPLRELVLEGCRNVTDLTPLLQCAQLETLIVPSQIRDLEILRGKPGLKTLGTSRPGRPVETFWQEYDARRR